MWRYSETLPVKDRNKMVTMGEGLTPLVKSEIDGIPVDMKLDYLCPTGSYKDRGISMLVSRLRELGIDRIIEDSSGNAGAAMAAYCARGDIESEIFVPSYTSAGKCVQIESYGSSLKRIPGSREDTTKAAMEASAETFYGSHNWNPWFVEGVKTYALEIWEQMEWAAPDHLIVPAGQGSLVLGAYRAFSELHKSGLIKKLPKIHGVQPANCAPLFLAYNKGLKTPVEIEKMETLAEGISSSQPLRGADVIRSINLCNGSFVAVKEEEIKAGVFELAEKGFYVEPTSAVVIPAFRDLVQKGVIKKGETTTLFLSGSGLKATDKILHLRD